MKTLSLLRTTSTLALVSLISLTTASGQTAPARVRYRLIDLGADNAIGNDISDSRLVIGSKDFGDVRHAAFWPTFHSSAD